MTDCGEERKERVAELLLKSILKGGSSSGRQTRFSLDERT